MYLIRSTVVLYNITLSPQFSTGLTTSTESATTIAEWLRSMSGEEAFSAANRTFHEKRGLCADQEEAHAKNTGEAGFEGLFVEDEEDDDVRREIHFCSGRKHGPHRTFSSNCKGGKEFLRLGSFDRGVRSGAEWRRLSGDCFLVLTMSGLSVVDENNNEGDEGSLSPASKSSLRGVYLYPDLTHAIEGTFFEDGRLQSGRFGAVAGVSFDESGILVPKVESARCEGAACVYDPSTAFHISKTPFTRDLYEQQIVYVAPSRYAE